MRKNRFFNTIITVILTVCFSTFTVNMNAQKHNVTKKDTTTKVIQSYNWEPVIEAIAQIESGKNPKAVSKSGKYVGYLQIAPCVVADCNEYLKTKKYTLNDRYSVEKSKEMFVLIQKRYNPTCNIEKAIRIWNGGCGYSNRKTQAYVNRVMKKFSQTAKR